MPRAQGCFSEPFCPVTVRDICTILIGPGATKLRKPKPERNYGSGPAGSCSIPASLWAARSRETSPGVSPTARASPRGAAAAGHGTSTQTDRPGAVSRTPGPGVSGVRRVWPQSRSGHSGTLQPPSGPQHRPASSQLSLRAERKPCRRRTATRGPSVPNADAP